MKRGTEEFDIDNRVLRNRDLVDDLDGLDERRFRVVHGDALSIQIYVGFAQHSGLREFLREGVVGDTNSGIDTGW